MKQTYNGWANKVQGLLLLILCMILFSCQKDFLDKKPDKSLLVPTTLKDFQALLDNTTIMNASPSLNMIASDEFYTTGDALNSLGAIYEENAYLWTKDDPYQGNRIVDWELPYQQVFYANVVLEGLRKIPADTYSQSQWNQIKGSALFFRSFAFYNLAQEFAKPYIGSSASTDLGIPLRLTSEVNAKSVRATIQTTYDQIIADLNLAQSLLPLSANIKSRPSQMAVQALLSRIYLSMGDYVNAKKMADTYLSSNNKLIDYNTLTASGINPFPPAIPSGNDEVVFYSALIPINFEYSSLTIVDSVLYRSFSTNDLRKSLLFLDNGGGIINFIGDYTGLAYYNFGGLATDEVYLNRAECFARNNDGTSALKDLNLLLQNRYKKNAYTPISSTDMNVILSAILNERKKELIARGTRWGDLRRLNQDSKYAITLKRIIYNQTYTLPPNDNRYVFPIPDNEITGSGIQQNPR
ncbi:SusD family protein [Mucilaginibacter pineti]|uniref:SusD family protein n=1 Tax=Mucilaginibacter pineti TaxID=1391627 RepID=A0A1G7P292_9SPHI|nr:RagB/SusD family nutrient uptake outer membrane protein [Mucilaginibacter pineti]SDF80415.1 SusD family protein [Mucilaginibacter pineti]